MKDKNKPLPDPPGWTPDGVFITGGLKWGVNPVTGGVCCYGPVETPPNNDQTAQDVKKVVPKFPQEESIRQNSPAIQTEVIMAQEKRCPGRPQIEDGEPISRRTFYRRRQKELQGVLL